MDSLEKYRVGVLTQDSKIWGENFETVKECEDYVLTVHNPKKAIIVVRETAEVVSIINF